MSTPVGEVGVSCHPAQSPAHRGHSRRGASAHRPEVERRLWAVLPGALGPGEQDQPHSLAWRDAAVTRAQKSQAVPWTLSLRTTLRGGGRRAERIARGQCDSDGGAHRPARDPRARGRSAEACGCLDPLRPQALPATAAPPALSPQEAL